MKQVCAETGLTYDTLKFYCNEGLIPNVKRDENNHRMFDERGVAWIKSLSCLKSCGMSIAEMRLYTELCLQGKKSIPERQAILRTKLSELKKKVQDLQESIDYIHWKQKFYDDILSGKTGYFSNILPDEDE